ncbi:hemin ABC transporter substrate-binding protein [Corallincola platygyrae]|uniref:Hemin ABC transporter substrate-binding protein n=1 Tax=Corallincola platygyrae TaxID=1193278 RepID=A0ABW4XK45_9GAMM
MSLLIHSLLASCTYLRRSAAVFITLLAVTASLGAHANDDASAAHRLVSTDASATELLLALGMQEQLVAIDVTSKLPSGSKKLPSVGYHRALSAEGLLGLKPTMVVGSEHMGPVAVVDALNKAEVTLVQLPIADSAADLKRNIDQLASALALESKGQNLIAKLDAKLAELAAKPLSQERIAFLLAMDPSKLRLAGAGTAGNALIDMLDATNVADYNNYRNVSAESLLSMQPTMILVVGRDSDAAVAELVKANPLLKHTPAGQNDRIMAVEGGSLVAGLSVSAVDEALRINQTMHTGQAMHISQAVRISHATNTHDQATSAHDGVAGSGAAR